MSYILVVYTVVAMAGNMGHYVKHDWRYLGTFANATACMSAAKQLGIISGEGARCLPTGTKKGGAQ